MHKMHKKCILYEPSYLVEYKTICVIHKEY